MRIHRLRLDDFRGIDHTEIEFAVPGITIVEGDNEVGKSSIPEGLHLLFDFPDSSRAAPVKSVQPVGRDVGSAVEAELSCGPYHFTYRKRWHRDTETVLSLTRPEVRQYTGREAHDRVRAILDEVLDTDLFAALHLTQGSDTALPRFAAAPTLGRALDLTAGAPLHGDHDALWDRVESERLRYWTPAGHPRKERTAALEQLESARSELDHATRTLAELEDDVRTVERLDADHRSLLARRTELSQSHTDLARRVGELELVRARVAQLRSAADLAEARVRAATERVDQRRRLRSRLERASSLVEELRAETSSRHHRVEEARRTRDRLAGLVADLTGEAEQATEAVDHAGRVVDHLRAKHDLHQLDERLTHIDAASRRCAAAERQLATSPVEPSTVEHLDTLAAALAAEVAAARVGGVAVTATAISPGPLTVDGDDHTLAAGQVHEVSALGPTHITVPGVISFRIDPGSHAEATRHRIDELRHQLDRACHDAGVADVAAAHTTLARRERAGHELELATAELRAAMGDATLDSLRRRHSILDDAVSGPAPSGADSTDLDAALATLEAARVRHTEARADLDAARSDAHHAVQTLHELEVALATATARLESASDDVQRAQAELGELDAHGTDADGAAALERAVAEQSEAVAAHAAAEAELVAAQPDDLARLLENASSSLERTDETIERTAEQLVSLRASLEVRGESGLHDTLNQAASRVAHLEREVEATERRAAAAQLLADTMGRHRTAGRLRHVTPFTQRIERLGRVVFGPDFGVEVDDDLSPSHRTLHGTRLSVDQLSVGAREQIGVLARLACASLVSEHGGAPVILDDALGWSDPDRLASMGAAIGLAGDDAQVIVLTCTPQRYATTGSARVVTLRRPPPPVAHALAPSPADD